VNQYALATLLVLRLVSASAQGTQDPEEGSASTTKTEAEQSSWDFRFSAYGYIFSGQNAYLQPTVAVDYGWLHLEGRYNYEALQTGSLWVGWNLAWGQDLKLSLTPMVGGIFGQLNGIGPGLEWSLAWGPLELYSENEFVIDLVDLEESYFYAWSELNVRPVEWLRAGVALQRTRAHATPREVSWGPVLGLAVWKVEVAAYWFNPGQSDAQYWVVYVGVNL
jgi:hypothetical protein